jgi:hypothetical protein
VCVRQIFPGCAGSHLSKKGFSARSGFAFAFSPTAPPFASEPSTPLRVRAPQFSASVVAMAMLVRPDHYQTEEALDSVRRLLGWGMPAFAGRIRAGTTPLGDLAAGEFVLFVSYLFCGWRYRFRRSSCCCWRSSDSNSNTSRPTPSSRWPSLSISVRCSWEWQLVLPFSASFLCW